jgi:hypothetical protein
MVGLASPPGASRVDIRGSERDRDGIDCDPLPRCWRRPYHRNGFDLTSGDSRLRSWPDLHLSRWDGRTPMMTPRPATPGGKGGKGVRNLFFMVEAWHASETHWNKFL